MVARDSFVFVCVCVFLGGGVFVGREGITLLAGRIVGTYRK